MNQKDIEKKALAFTTFMNFLLTCAGLWVWLATDIQALFLDFFFSFIALISTLTATKISKISSKKTKTFPNGMQFLEPLYSIFKTLLIVSLLVFSVGKTSITAYQYFKYGTGTPLNLTPVLPYTISMFVLCSIISINNTIQNKKINNVSTMLQTEAKMNFIDGLQSLVIGIATFLLLLTDMNGKFGFLYYTGDFFVTTILVLVTIKQPIAEIINAFKEVTGAITKDREINEFINKIVDEKLANLEYSYNIYKKGMFINIVVNVKSKIDENIYKLLLEKKEEILKEVTTKYQNSSLEYIIN